MLLSLSNSFSATTIPGISILFYVLSPQLHRRPAAQVPSCPGAQLPRRPGAWGLTGCNVSAPCLLTGTAIFYFFHHSLLNIRLTGVFLLRSPLRQGQGESCIGIKSHVVSIWSYFFIRRYSTDGSIAANTVLDSSGMVTSLFIVLDLPLILEVDAGKKKIHRREGTRLYAIEGNSTYFENISQFRKVFKISHCGRDENVVIDVAIGDIVAKKEVPGWYASCLRRPLLAIFDDACMTTSSAKSCSLQQRQLIR